MAIAILTAVAGVTVFAGALLLGIPDAAAAVADPATEFAQYQDAVRALAEMLGRPDIPANDPELLAAVQLAQDEFADLSPDVQENERRRYTIALLGSALTGAPTDAGVKQYLAAWLLAMLPPGSVPQAELTLAGLSYNRAAP